MREKRFTLDSDFVNVTSQVVWDNHEKKGLTLVKIVDCLNEQQATINKLRKILAEAEDTIEIRLQAEIERLKENEVKECQFCGEFRTEYHEYEDYSWSAEDYCNAGHYLEDTDPNTCKDYWDK